MKKYLVNVYDVQNKRKTKLVVKADSLEEASIIAMDYCRAKQKES